MELSKKLELVKNPYGVARITQNIGKFTCSLCGEVAEYVVFSSPLDPEFDVCQKCLDNN